MVGNLASFRDSWCTAVRQRLGVAAVNPFDEPCAGGQGGKVATATASFYLCPRSLLARACYGAHLKVTA